jgi:hypothetical protein
MATQTLAELEKLFSKDINRAIAQDIIEVNPLFDMLPFTGYVGPAIIVPREDVIGDAQALAVGGTITANNPAVYDDSSIFKATTLIGSVEMNGLVQAQSVSAGGDQLAQEVSSKAKGVGRLFQQGIASGTGTAPVMNSLHSLCDATQYTTASAGQPLSFELLDELADLVKAKDGQVDWMIMSRRTMRSLRTLMRAMNGNTLEHIEMPMGPGGVRRTVLAYSGIPVFVNDHLSVTETANGAALTGGALTSVWAGVFDEGSRRVGVSAIYPAGSSAGIQFEQVGKKVDADEQVYHVKWYTNLALFNRRGLARLPSINN